MDGDSAMSSGLWVYRARLKYVVDGDTMDFEVDLGFRVRHLIRVRVLGLDTPEMRGEERHRGLAAKERALELMTNSTEWPFLLRTEKDSTDKYGRWLADIRLEDGRDYATVMRAEGYVKGVVA